MKNKLITEYSESQLQGLNLETRLKISESEEVALAKNLLRGALEAVYKSCNIVALNSVWECYFDDFEDVLKLYPANVTEIVSVKYKDINGTQQTLSTADYQQDLVSRPARIIVNQNSVFPATDESTNNVVIQFRAGYSSFDTMPEMLKVAIYMIVGHWYENRQDVVVGRTISQMPLASEYILEKYRVKEL